jgi:uncharacterized protein
MLAYRIRPEWLGPPVRVPSRCGRDAIDGVKFLSDDQTVLKVRVRAVPDDGAANEG